MAVCLFLGHRESYDPDLETRIQETVAGIVRYNQTVDFLFCQTGVYYDLCVAAVQGAKAANPDKEICLTQVKLSGPTASWADRGLTPIPVVGKTASAAQEKKLLRWTVQQASHMISYLYEDMFEPLNQIYAYAQKEGVTTFDLTSDETAAFIRAQVLQLPERERLVLQGLGAGRTRKDLAQELAVSASYIQQLTGYGSQQIKEAAKRRKWALEHPCTLQNGIVTPVDGIRAPWQRIL